MNKRQFRVAICVNVISLTILLPLSAIFISDIINETIANYSQLRSNLTGIGLGVSAFLWYLTFVLIRKSK